MPTPGDESVLGTYVATDVDEGDRTETNRRSRYHEGEAVAGRRRRGRVQARRRLTVSSGSRPSPNFESPADADNNSVYKVSIIATDDDGCDGYNRDVTITGEEHRRVGKVTLTAHPAAPSGGRSLATLFRRRRRRNNLKWQWYERHQPDGYLYWPSTMRHDRQYTPKDTVPAVEDDPETPTIDESAAEIPSDEGTVPPGERSPTGTASR